MSKIQTAIVETDRAKREGSYGVENSRPPSFHSRRKIHMLTIHHPKAASAHHTVRALLVVGLVLFFVARPLAQNLPDVTAMSVEDLMNVQVTSVSKRTHKLADAAADIFVITQEGLRRSA